MKRYLDYTLEELAVLDEAAVQRLIDIEVAYDHIAPVSPPTPLKPESLGINKSVQAFRVQGTIYATEDDAKIAQGLKIMREDYDCAAGYCYKYLEPVEGSAIDLVHFYPKDDVISNAGRLRDLSQKTEKYDQENRAHREYLKKVGACRDRVRDAFYEALAHQRKILAAQEVFNSYVDLANGDKGVARTFFRNTYKNQFDIIKAVLGEDPVEGSHEEAAG